MVGIHPSSVYIIGIHFTIFHAALGYLAGGPAHWPAATSSAPSADGSGAGGGGGGPELAAARAPWMVGAEAGGRRLCDGPPDRAPPGAPAGGRLAGTSPTDWRVDCGCTAVVAVAGPSRIYVANAGDAAAVLCRPGMPPEELSQCHRPDGG